MLRASEVVFPLAATKGCKFHFAQAIITRIEGVKELRECYQNDEDSEKGWSCSTFESFNSLYFSNLKNNNHSFAAKWLQAW